MLHRPTGPPTPQQEWSQGQLLAGPKLSLRATKGISDPNEGKSTGNLAVREQVKFQRPLGLKANPLASSRLPLPPPARAPLFSLFPRDAPGGAAGHRELQVPRTLCHLHVVSAAPLPHSPLLNPVGKGCGNSPEQLKGTINASLQELFKTLLGLQPQI